MGLGRAHGRSGATGSEETRRARNRGARLGEGDDPDVWVRTVGEGRRGAADTGGARAGGVWAVRGMALGQRGDRSWAGWVEGEVGRCGGKERKRVGPGVREWAEAAAGPRGAARV